MKWPRTPAAWERREKVLALCLAALVAGGALAPFIGWAALPTAVAIALALGTIGKLLIGTRKATLEETLEEANLDRRLRARIESVGSVDPRRIGVDPATQDVLPGGEVPQYLPRTKDHEARQALADAFSGEGRWIVAVCGSSKVGKSRLLFEAIKWYGGRGQKVHLVAPKDGAAVKSLLQPEQLPSQLDGEEIVVWLDDLETFVAEGVDLDALREWHERNGVIFAVTYGGKGSERVRETGDTGLSVITETLLQHAKQVSLAKTDTAELQALPDDVSDSLRQEIEKHGLAAAMVSGPALERKLMTGRHAPGEPECPAGVAVARAAIDWARCGRTDPIPDKKLRELWEHYLPAGVQASDEQFDAGLEWALRPVSGTIALLQAVASFLPYDYIVGFVESQQEGGPTEAAWRCALEEPDPGQAFSVGARADLYGRGVDAETAMMIASGASDPKFARIAFHNLGILLERREAEEEAQAAFEMADEMGVGPASSNLGILLQAQNDLEGAEAAFRRASQRSSSFGAFNLGLLLKRKGDLAGAEEAFRHAEELGDQDAANSLGALLQDKGDLDGAEAAYRRGAERENLEAIFNLGLLRDTTGDLQGAMAAYRQADDLGYGAAASNLGVLLKRTGDPQGAEEAFRRAVARGRREKAAFNLGVVLQEKGDLRGAEEAYQMAIEAGDGRGAVNLGVLRHDHDDLEGAEKAFRQGIEMGDSIGGLYLGLLLFRRGDAESAAAILNEALDSDNEQTVQLTKELLNRLSQD